MFLITMLAQAKLALRVLGLAVLVQCSVLATQARAQGLPKKAMKIGMVDSLFTDVSPVMVKMGSVMFATLMKTSTGMDGEMVTGGQAADGRQAPQRRQARPGRVPRRGVRLGPAAVSRPARS